MEIINNIFTEDGSLYATEVKDIDNNGKLISRSIIENYESLGKKTENRHYLDIDDLFDKNRRLISFKVLTKDDCGVRIERKLVDDFIPDSVMVQFTTTYNKDRLAFTGYYDPFYETSIDWRLYFKTLDCFIDNEDDSREDYVETRHYTYIERGEKEDVYTTVFLIKHTSVTKKETAVTYNIVVGNGDDSDTRVIAYEFLRIKEDDPNTPEIFKRIIDAFYSQPITDNHHINIENMISVEDIYDMIKSLPKDRVYINIMHDHAKVIYYRDENNIVKCISQVKGSEEKEYDGEVIEAFENIIVTRDNAQEICDIVIGLDK